MNFTETEVKYSSDVIKILNIVQKYIPGAVIAGGYIRDTIIGCKPKDVDIFIPFVENADELLFAIEKDIYDSRQNNGSLEWYFHAGAYVREMFGARYMPQSEVTRVWDIRVPADNTPYQIIMLQKDLDIRERIALYDFGFCQAYFNGNKTYVSEAFTEDVANKTFTLIYCEDKEQLDRSLRRADRFSKRLPNWTFRMERKLQCFNKLDLQLQCKYNPGFDYLKE